MCGKEKKDSRERFEESTLVREDMRSEKGRIPTFEVLLSFDRHFPNLFFLNILQDTSCNLTVVIKIINFWKFQTWISRILIFSSLQTVLARVQKSDESFENYFFHKVWLCKFLNLSVREVRDEIACGLNSQARFGWAYLILSTYTSTNDILTDLRSINEVHTKRRKKATGPRKKDFPNSKNHEKRKSSSFANWSSNGGKKTLSYNGGAHTSNNLKLSTPIDNSVEPWKTDQIEMNEIKMNWIRERCICPSKALSVKFSWSKWLKENCDGI